MLRTLASSSARLALAGANSRRQTGRGVATAAGTAVPAVRLAGLGERGRGRRGGREERVGPLGPARRSAKRREGARPAQRTTASHHHPATPISLPAPTFLQKATASAAAVALAYNPNPGNPARNDGAGYPQIYGTGGAGSAGYGAVPPPAARQEPLLQRLTSGGKRMALSAVAGFFAGKVFQKVTATVFYGIVGLMLVTQYLAYKGTLNVKWGGVFSKAARFLDLDKDGSFGIGDLKAAGWGGASLVARLVPSAGGFVAGFAYGVLG